MNKITPHHFAGAAALTAAAMICSTSLGQATPQPSPSSPRVQPISPGTPSKPSTPVQPTSPAKQADPNNPAPATNPAAPVQPGATPVQPGTNPVQPGTAPVQPGTTPVQPIVPGAVVPAITHQPTDQNGQRLFTVEAAQEAHFRDFTTRLTRMEQQLATSNDQLLHDLGDVRMNGGDTNAKVDKMFVIFQKSLQQNKQMQSFLVEMRTALTGQTNAATNNPAANPANPTTVPGTDIPVTTPADPSAPTTPGTGNPTNTPRTPTSNPSSPTPPTTTPR